jgi:short-subunit dehydrogenase
MVSPEKAAKKALKDAYNNKDISIYGIHVKIAVFLTRFFPEKWIMKFWLLQQGIK